MKGWAMKKSVENVCRLLFFVLLIGNFTTMVLAESNNRAFAQESELDNWIIYNNSVGGSDTADWFALRVSKIGNFSAVLTPYSADVDLSVYKNNTYVGGSAEFGTSIDRVDVGRVDPGDLIHVGVIPYGAGTLKGYNLATLMSNTVALGNISAVGYASPSDPFIACSIIGDTATRTIIVAESRQSGIDTELYFAPLSVPVGSVRSSSLAHYNNDYPGLVPATGRSLGRRTDSALIESNIRGAWCAFVFSRSGSGEVSIQISDENLF